MRDHPFQWGQSIRRPGKPVGPSRPLMPWRIPQAAIRMATRVNFQRRRDGPWVIVMVPMEDEDHMYPSRVRFYTRKKAGKKMTGATCDSISKAYRFPVKILARKHMNRYMDQHRNTWCELIPFSIVWAIVHASHVPWKTAVHKSVDIQYPKEPPQ